MKKQLEFQKILYALMRVSLKQLFLAIMFAGISTAGSLPAQNLLNRKLSLSHKNSSLSRILTDIEKKVQVKFTYQSQILPDQKVYSVDYKDNSLSEILDDLLIPIGIQYQIIGRQVVMTKQPDPEVNLLPTEVAPVDLRVKGVVVDEKGGGLPGVSILIKGTQKGTVSNADGSFSIDVPNGDAVLVFSFVGYLSFEDRVGSRTQMEISLLPDEKALDEVVVTALGVQRKSRALGYSVGEVKNEELTRVPQENIVNSLNGRVSGVRVINTTPDLNSDPMVLIRGYTSLSGGNSPLIVVDGLPTGTDISVMSDLSADNIESVSVLKGPSAAALYGSRAGSGVLLITTKNGSKGKNGIGVRVNSAYSATVPYRFTPIQQGFANGSNGNFDQTSNLWWGPEMGTSVARFGTNGVATPLQSYPDNIKNFGNVGNSFVNDIIVSNSSDKLSFSLSLSDTRGTGVYPGSELRKNAIAFSATHH